MTGLKLANQRFPFAISYNACAHFDFFLSIKSVCLYGKGEEVLKILKMGILTFLRIIGTLVEFIESKYVEHALRKSTKQSQIIVVTL